MNRQLGCVVLGLMALAGCSRGGEEEPSARSDTDPAIERYCELSDRLDEASDALVNPDADTDDKIAQSFAALMQEHGEEFDALVAAAPAEIKDDVALGVEAFRKAATGDFSALEAFDQTRVSRYDAEHCG